MKIILLTFALVVCRLMFVVQSQRKSWNLKVIRGNTTTPEKWPWFVLVQYSKHPSARYDRCGASIIDDDLLLTAAHCLCQMDENYVMSRTSNGTHSTCHELDVPKEKITLTAAIRKLDSVNEPFRQLRHVKDILFEPTGLDLAIIKTTEKFNFASSRNVTLVQKIGIGSKSLRHNQEVYAGGFGAIEVKRLNESVVNLTFATQLQEVRLLVFTDMECYVPGWCGNHCICAFYSRNPPAYINICEGDSGGPIIARNDHGGWELVGVISLFGADNTTVDSFCAHPSGYSKNVDITTGPAHCFIKKTKYENWKNRNKEKEKL